ncbi:MAG TPA: multicopper oxidase family protein [Gemmatimonadaceae bacterium]|nr:multicopper oxidase family protein [Gemmatimonadaceae bacterium]
MKFVVAVMLIASGAAAQTTPSRDTSMANMPGMAGMSNMPGMAMMPIPMPPGMVVMPGLMGLTPAVAKTFLPSGPAESEAVARKEIRLKNGDTLDLAATLVREMIGDHQTIAYAYNTQIAGPLIRVPQNATIMVRFTNKIDLPTAVHWHGVRLDNASDGAPGLTQDPVASGKGYLYRVHFPDAGIYWYHAHVREDIEQPMGLYGNIIVDSPDPHYYEPANKEAVLMLGDILVYHDTLIPFGAEQPDFTLMGRVGNVIRVNAQPTYALNVAQGSVVRFYLTNVASSRTFNVSFGDAPIKVVASDESLFEHEELVPSVVLGPAERYVVDVRFPHPGRYAFVNAVQAINHFQGEFTPEVDTLGFVTVSAAPAAPSYASSFATLHANAAVSADIAHYRPAFDHTPDKTFRLTLKTNGLPLATVQFMSIDTAYFAPVEWVDGMPDMNWLSTASQVRWVIHDEASGKDNMDIDWHVPVGSTPVIRIINDDRSFHPMQHPIHLHGQRMLVISRDGVPTKNLVWKDTVIIPVGSTVDLLVDASNPGAWMLHCHISEHLESGMMTVMHVDR